MIRISPTMLDSFRLYREAEFISAEEMENRILRLPTPETPAMALGTAAHACLAGVCERLGGDPAAYRSGEYVFDAVSIDGARAGLEKALPEVPGYIDLMVGGVLVRLGGRTDYLYGNTVYDIKTSDKPIDPDKPDRSMQWRCYMLIFNVKRIYYRHLWLNCMENGIWEVKDWHEVALYSYPDLRRDVLAQLGLLLEFARSRGIFDRIATVDEAA